MISYPRVSIIILNWNGWKDSIECLESIFQINYPIYDVILVDNNSDDNSIKHILDYCKGSFDKDSSFGSGVASKSISVREVDEHGHESKIEEFTGLPSNERLTIIKIDQNVGFAGGNNIGMGYALENCFPSYLLLLNNDTVVEKNFLNELVEVAESEIEAGFLSPKIYFYNFDQKKNIIQFAGSTLNFWLFKPHQTGIFKTDEDRYNNITEIAFAHGSCMLMNSDMINEIGMFDEDYFCYREENDLCYRGAKSGWKSFYVPNSKIWHKGGKSTGGNVSSFVVFLINRNNFFIVKKHGTPMQKVVYLFYFLGFHLWFYLLIYTLYYHNYDLCKSFLKGSKAGLTYFFNDKVIGA